MKVSVQRERGLKMVQPAFKGYLAHVHRGIAWLYHIEMMELTHAHKGSCSCVKRK